MIKGIAKEMIIVILLLIVIALILGIVFYDYIPSNKTVPVKEKSYAFPDDIREELNENFEDAQNIVETYYIDSTDLNAYESKKDYDKGKANPFADYSNKSVTNNTNSENNSVNTEKNEVYINKPGKV